MGANHLRIKIDPPRDTNTHNIDSSLTRHFGLANWYGGFFFFEIFGGLKYAAFMLDNYYLAFCGIDFNMSI